MRERCLPAARVINLLSLSASPPNDDGRTALRHALGVLQEIIAENERDGSMGAIASTELCNRLLEVDGLSALDRLQKLPDADIAAMSSSIMQHIVPRIWSC